MSHNNDPSPFLSIGLPDELNMAPLDRDGWPEDEPMTDEEMDRLYEVHVKSTGEIIAIGNVAAVEAVCNLFRKTG